jgi:ATP-dependent exoDNAse (exonuclease V) beta subunit
MELQLESQEDQNIKQVLAMHTHDSIAYKRCRRKWGFSSPWRRNLEPIAENQNINLWFGSGFHFALEDFHGYNKLQSPEIALEMYYNAFKEEERPSGADDITELGMGMFTYYQKWLQRHMKGYQTLYIDGVPQVEVGFTLELNELSEIAGVPVYYHGTLDRVVVDEHGGWYIVDYKTAATIDTNKLATVPQISIFMGSRTVVSTSNRRLHIFTVC